MKNKNWVPEFISQNSLPFAFLVAVAATVGSLYLSDVVGFIPCSLCWYQRIFMYPLAIILGIATLKNDLKVTRYAIPLAVIGAVIAAYQYILQMSPIPLPCTGTAVSCATKQLVLFGFITIPLMSFAAFSLMLFFLFLVQRSKK